MASLTTSLPEVERQIAAARVDAEAVRYHTHLAMPWLHAHVMSHVLLYVAADSLPVSPLPSACPVLSHQSHIAPRVCRCHKEATDATRFCRCCCRFALCVQLCDATAGEEALARGRNALRELIAARCADLQRRKQLSDEETATMRDKLTHDWCHSKVSVITDCDATGITHTGEAYYSWCSL